MKAIIVLALLAAPLAVNAKPACNSPSEADVANLFEQWNGALQTRDPAQVAAIYQPDAVLLPTLSNQVRLTTAEREDYFAHFLANQPSGRIVSRTIHSRCDSAVDAGLYEFTFAATGETVRARYSYTWNWDGERWLIGSHHSSVMPQG
ncbi:calcium/calmodulin dependent protein kinase II association-domain-containing protein [Pseudomonas sp. M47T1]|uniref:SgcJ/EcaC family oxidoreductase n=1 Tax=unclassified Pseudomonas TaxID=196821 RepID=UPI0002608C22|nr:SgcJ/EcaC family oxidoreductase [Pseudomonas sp. M47T1]EIK95897.1 calcium/calmodulin dependent protein kinase II association-domain-containing protein [Pseudomonas sp. M47T1]